MARLVDLFTFSGRVGEVVGCTGAHGFYVRSRPRKSRSQATPRQLEVREKFAMASGFLKPLKELIYEGFLGAHPRGNKVSAMNAAVSHLINHAINGEFPDLTVNPAEVRLSRGKLAKLAITGFGRKDRSVEVNWEYGGARASGHSDDRVRVVVYNLQEKTVMINDTVRQSGEITVDVAEEPTGSELLVYVYVADRRGKWFSNSQFLGKVVVEHG